jgi:diaminohydroxyphosphoribosylaminopyrimidine deaminase / 5-amino-6-(5-phosphoribosylamino)uracil reductase
VGPEARLSVDDTRWMERALELARLSDGSVAPRPPVGAVVVQDGRIVGEGRTRRKPGPHAEAAALEAAGDAARGSTVYVSLEPCTLAVSKPKSCAQLLIEAGVARVVASIADPCPEIDGRGFEMLRDAGIEVEVGPSAQAAARLIEPFAKWITSKIPFVTLKLAASLDGKVAAPDGTSRWISGEESRADVHDLRRTVDAVLVGSGTVLTDDPLLTYRGDAEADQPLRVVLDSSGRVPATAKVRNADAETLVLTAEDLPAADGGLDVNAVLELLGERGICHVLLEGGPTLAASFVEAGLVDRFRLYLAPTIIGGDAPGLFTSGVKTLADAWKLRIEDVRRIGEDIRIDAVRA